MSQHRLRRGDSHPAHRRSQITHGNKLDRTLAVIAILKLVVYMSWMIAHDDFVYVIADYGLTLLIVGIVQLVRRGPSTPWVVGSIVISVIGALVQQSGFALHRHFNHNDLYHVIQLVALWLLYRGGRFESGRLTTETQRHRGGRRISF